MTDRRTTDDGMTAVELAEQMLSSKYGLVRGDDGFMRAARASELRIVATALTTLQQEKAALELVNAGETNRADVEMQRADKAEATTRRLREALEWLREMAASVPPIEPRGGQHAGYSQWNMTVGTKREILRIIDAALAASPTEDRTKDDGMTAEPMAPSALDLAKKILADGVRDEISLNTETGGDAVTVYIGRWMHLDAAGALALAKALATLQQEKAALLIELAELRKAVVK